MVDEEEQLKEMCIIMINLLDKLKNNGQINHEEYNEHIRMKKQFLDSLNQKS